MVIRAVTLAMGIRNYLIDGGPHRARPRSATNCSDGAIRLFMATGARSDPEPGQPPVPLHPMPPTAHLGCSEGPGLLATKARSDVLSVGH